MIDEITVHLGVLTVSLHIPHAQSLKEKRMVLKSLKERLRHRHNASICECGNQDKWQRAIVAVAIINNDQKFIDSSFQNILLFIEGFDNLVLCEKEINYY